MVFLLDIVSVIIAMAIILTLDLIGWFVEKGLFNLAAGMLAVYATADVFRSQGVVVSIAYDASLGQFQTYTVDPNLMAICFAILAIMSLFFLFFMRESLT